MFLRHLLLITMLCLTPAFSVNPTFYIPEKAKVYTPIVDEEIKNVLPDFRLKPYFGALIEHETCIKLTYKSCFSPKQQFKTKWDNGLPREQGAGLGMLTRAWKKNGLLRMDSLTDIKRRYPRDLNELSWDTILDRPDLQIRSMLLLWRSNYDRFPPDMNTLNKIAMADSAYNGGLRYLNKERSLCKLRAGCDPLEWFGNVELQNARGTRILYGKRTAHDINRHHVKDVLINRLGKYVQLWYEEIESQQ